MKDKESALEKFLLHKINTDLNTSFEGEYLIDLRLGKLDDSDYNQGFGEAYYEHLLTVKTSKVFDFSNLTVLLENLKILKYFENIEGNDKVELFGYDVKIFYKEEYLLNLLETEEYQTFKRSYDGIEKFDL